MQDPVPLLRPGLFSYSFLFFCSQSCRHRRGETESKGVGRARCPRSQACKRPDVQRTNVNGVKYNRADVYRVRCAQGFMSMAQSVHRARMGRSGVLAVIFSMSVIFFQI